MKNSEHGFTLIEILTVVVIIGIILAIALPNYQQSVYKAKRNDARTSLSTLAQRLERCQTQFGRYDHAGCAVTSPATTEEGHYSIVTTRTATTYALTATPVGGQLGDKQCASLTLNHLGVRAATGTKKEACW